MLANVHYNVGRCPCNAGSTVIIIARGSDSQTREQQLMEQKNAGLAKSGAYPAPSDERHPCVCVCAEVALHASYVRACRYMALWRCVDTGLAIGRRHGAISCKSRLKIKCWPTAVGRTMCPKLGGRFKLTWMLENRDVDFAELDVDLELVVGWRNVPLTNLHKYQQTHWKVLQTAIKHP